MKSYWLVKDDGNQIEAKFKSKKEAKQFFDDAINQLNNCIDEQPVILEFDNRTKSSKIEQLLDFVECRIDDYKNFVHQISNLKSLPNYISEEVLGVLNKIHEDLKLIWLDFKNITEDKDEHQISIEDRLKSGIKGVITTCEIIKKRMVSKFYEDKEVISFDEILHHLNQIITELYRILTQPGIIDMFRESIGPAGFGRDYGLIDIEELKSKLDMNSDVGKEAMAKNTIFPEENSGIGRIEIEMDADFK